MRQIRAQIIKAESSPGHYADSFHFPVASSAEKQNRTGGTDDRTDKMESITQNKTIAVHLIEKKEEFQQLNVA